MWPVERASCTVHCASDNCARTVIYYCCSELGGRGADRLTRPNILARHQGQLSAGQGVYKGKTKGTRQIQAAWELAGSLCGDTHRAKVLTRLMPGWYDLSTPRWTNGEDGGIRLGQRLPPHVSHAGGNDRAKGGGWIGNGWERERSGALFIIKSQGRALYPQLTCDARSGHGSVANPRKRSFIKAGCDALHAPRSPPAGQRSGADENAVVSTGRQRGVLGPRSTEHAARGPTPSARLSGGEVLLIVARLVRPTERVWWTYLGTPLRIWVTRLHRGIISDKPQGKAFQHFDFTQPGCIGYRGADTASWTPFKSIVTRDKFNGPSHGFTDSHGVCSLPSITRDS
ncbi:hypothetical protein C8R47DRAFT_1078247 [Mycena vitilis]|nr:hypothetical protein C8R47DRAFT_1078247 [Mycena vitilis]